MNVSNRLLLCIVLCLACVCPAFAQDAIKAADDKVAPLRSIQQVDVGNWRYKAGEVANAQDPKLDDSTWKSNPNSVFLWGHGNLCWLRTRIVIPEKVAGVPIAGSQVTLKCGVDDDGVLYINGKEIGPIHWDQGSAVLTTNAQPGQVFDIAIKNINPIGEGRLLLANLQYNTFDSVREPVKAYLEKYDLVRDLCTLADPAACAKYQPVLTKAVEQLNLNALATGKPDEFLSSLKVSDAQLATADDAIHAFKIDLIGHAHIDLCWLWEWPETIQVCKNTFGTVSKLMDEYPGFVFSQSQGAAYLAMQENAPEVFATIKDRVKRGQWDPGTASTWVEGDTNMASGEAIARQLLYGKRYIMQQFGIEPTVCWEPDTFGHAWTVPQILAKSGVKYYYFMRGSSGNPLFWWQSPDGSKVLAYNCPNYNGNVNADQLWKNALDFERKAGSYELPHAFGAGDHGGGPTRDMLKTAQELSTRKDYPRISFIKAQDFYESAVKSGKSFPTWNNEMNHVFEGCYTTHSDMKKWNRECENLLPTAEVFSSVASFYGVSYPGAAFEKSWRDTCFNQFHDIFCGTAIHPVYNYAKQLRDGVTTQGKAALNTALTSIASQIKTKGPGLPIVVFNPLAWTRTDSVNIPTPFPNEKTEVKIVDAAGTSYPAQVRDGKLYFTARGVPALGYKVFWAKRALKPAAGGVKSSGTVLENKFFIVKVDPTLGTVTSIYDKLNHREVVPKGESTAVMQMRQEVEGNAWFLTRVIGSEDLVGRAKVTVTDIGSARSAIAIANTSDKSSIIQEVAIYDDVPRIDLHTTVDWHPGSDRGKRPFLKELFPTGLKDGKASFDIPFGSIERPMDGSEVPGQKWMDVSNSTYGVSLLNDCKYGFEVKDGVMKPSLIRATVGPDPTPDDGIHEWTLSLYPHKGDWRTAGTPRRGYELNEPLLAVSAPAHGGMLPAAKSYLSVSSPNVIVTALKKAEDDGSIILRFYETDGRPCKVTIKTGLPVRSFVETDILERPVGKKQVIRNRAFTVNVGKCEIKTYKLIP